MRDFLKALDSTRTNERIELLRDLIPKDGASRWVRDQVERYLAEQRQFRNAMERAGDDSVASNLYRNRGLSLDTNFRPNFAVETTLRGLKEPVTRAAIIGPGLDFTDKDSGYDYYPLQTLQPFALVDSLLRLGLANVRNLRVSVFDISPLSLGHLARAAGKPYTIQMVLPRDRQWTSGARDYWRAFGERVGVPVAPLTPPKQVEMSSGERFEYAVRWWMRSNHGISMR